MDELLDRLKRERRWAVVLFVVAGLTFGAVQFVFAPGSNEADRDPAGIAVDSGTTP